MLGTYSCTSRIFTCQGTKLVWHCCGHVFINGLWCLLRVSCLAKEICLSLNFFSLFWRLLAQKFQQMNKNCKTITCTKTVNTKMSISLFHLHIIDLSCYVCHTDLSEWGLNIKSDLSLNKHFIYLSFYWAT